ncbi:hypothetical protein EVAR_74232_1 [Eumeta japonica]|uniref:Uncharacterized protein n=1 Tax=Eumeta variegata TaxID=151549 RepID=A0A4C1SCL2_EUMVA|nr:hypothetical protein EVAR_74232_1 [Eumeta japonica]
MVTAAHGNSQPPQYSRKRNANKHPSIPALTLNYSPRIRGVPDRPRHECERRQKDVYANGDAIDIRKGTSSAVILFKSRQNTVKSPQRNDRDCARSDFKAGSGPASRMDRDRDRD